MMQSKRARGWLVLGALAACQWACTNMRPVGSLGAASDTPARIAAADVRAGTMGIMP